MLSVIVCSISPDNLNELSKNIKETAGVPVEIIGIDNRELNWSISKVYNHAASQAKYENLLFVHEDVRFHSQNWGGYVLAKLNEPDCGVIGYAGTKIMRNVYSGWYQSVKWQCMMLYQGRPSDGASFQAYRATLEKPFEEVVALDGLAMFMRKDVWQQYRFDEENLTGFHCYDVDLTLRIAHEGKYHNYVCVSPNALVEHKSLGNFSEAWFDETIKIYNLRWKNLLPLSVPGFTMSKGRIRRYERKAAKFFMKNAFKCSYSRKYQVLADYVFRIFHLR